MDTERDQYFSPQDTWWWLDEEYSRWLDELEMLAEMKRVDNE